MSLDLTDALTLLDSLAQQGINIIESGFGSNSTGYDNNRTQILAGDINVAADLAPAFKPDPTNDISPGFVARLKALNTHLDPTLDGYLTSNDARVHPALRDYLKWPLKPSNIFQSPVLSGGTKLGSYVLSGMSAGAFTDGVAVDLTKFGKIWLTVKIVGQTVSADITVTIVGKKIDNSSQSKVVTLTSGSVVNTHFNVGTLGVSADHFVDVTAVTVTGGGASDAFELESRLERTVAL